MLVAPQLPVDRRPVRRAPFGCWRRREKRRLQRRLRQPFSGRGVQPGPRRSVQISPDRRAREPRARRYRAHVRAQLRTQPQNFPDPPHFRPRSRHYQPRQKGRIVVAITSTSAAAPPPPDWRIGRPQVAVTIGLRWRLQSASGGDYVRPVQPRPGDSTVGGHIVGQVASPFKRAAPFLDSSRSWVERQMA